MFIRMKQDIKERIMALWGKGDPRWIVEERPDATNVNNWHWTEKNASEWSKNKIKELLIGLEVKSDEAVCKIIEITKLEGEATANNRKAKLIFFYEFEIEASWDGWFTTDEDVKFGGKLEIPNLSDENGADDIDVNVTLNSSDLGDDSAYKLKEIMRLKGSILIREKLKLFINQLKEEYGKDLILPTKKSEANLVGINCEPSQAKTKEISKNLDQENQKNANKLKNVQIGVQISTKCLSLKENFKCTAHELYSAFVVPEMVQAFTRAPCQVDATPGGRFTMMNGALDGVFKELVPSDKIVMTWRMKSWPAGHYSDVTLRFIQTDEDTQLQLEQKQIPDSHYENTEEGWKRHYFEAMKQTFGFGAKLF